ncbi:MAG TPA: hypothetical protein VHZ04_01850 [Candidatus Paceibacterota bacterium]|nr:hypothetical protein [Candidatus Paceibacterota bacterium]
MAIQQMTLRRFLVKKLGEAVEDTRDRTQQTKSSVPDTIENVVLKLRRGITERTLRPLLKEYFGVSDSQMIVRPGFVFVRGVPGEAPSYAAVIQYSGIFAGGSISINLTKHS